MPRSKSSQSYKQRKKLRQRKTGQAGCPELVQSALQLQQAGDLVGAKDIYLQVLARDAGNADAWHLLGMLLFAAGEVGEAIECVENANRLVPCNPAVLANLGLVYRAAGNLASARESLEQALKLDPKNANHCNSLGVICLELRDFSAARANFEQALVLDPHLPNAAMNLANLAQQQGDHLVAAEVYNQLLQRNPGDAQLLTNLGETLRSLGRWAEAVKVFEQALDRAPGTVEARINLGRTRVNLQQTEQAEQQFNTLIEDHPHLAKPYHYLGQLRYGQKRFEEALELLQHSLELDPADCNSRTTLGFVWQEMGRLAKAEACFREVIAADPTRSESHSSLLFLMSNNPAIGPQELLDEHKRWGLLHANRPSGMEFASCRRPERRLRIGYVSPDLRQHAVAAYFEPVLEAHHTDQVETFCYADVSVPDATTERLRQHSDHWRFITGHSDGRVAEFIREDQIDILVDLAGHTAGNRLKMFGLKPAPIQATWIGYPNTTGVPAMDYRFSCETQNPSSEPSYHTENLIRMAHGSFCFQRPGNAPDISRLPAEASGYVTLGSLHRPMKITEGVRDLWAGVLASCPNACLLVFNTRFNDESAAELMAGLVRRGVDANRIRIQNKIRGNSYLEVYHQIDIGLDVFPWAGATTTMEAVFMGIPVVALYGDRRSSRSTAAIMNNIGHPELIVRDPDQYRQAVQDLAGDLPRLASLRKTLRPDAERTVMDVERFTCELETIYRQMWQSWVRDPSAG